MNFHLAITFVFVVLFWKNIEARRLCTCLVHGDPHYKTFDGLNFDFMGQCSYVLTETKDQNGKCSFSVRVVNRGDSKNSYTDAIEVVFNKHVLRLGQKYSLSVDGKEARYKAVSEGEMLQIFMTGAWMTLVSKTCGMRVEWDGSGNAFIRIDRGQNANRVQGLCGNCNDNVPDDKTMKNGAIAPNFSNLGDSFIAHYTDDFAKQCRSQTPPLRPQPCAGLWERKVRESMYCGLYLSISGPFSACLAKSKTVREAMFTACRYDVCMHSDKPEDLDRLRCSSMAVYAALCAEMGLPGIDWRRHYRCELTCGPNQEYSPLIEPCPTTCDNLRDGKCSCCSELIKKEGCRCRPGFIQHGTECLAENSCPKTKELELFKFASEGSYNKTEMHTINTQHREVGKNVTTSDQEEGVTRNTQTGERRTTQAEKYAMNESSKGKMTGAFRGEHIAMAGGEQPEWLRKFLMMDI